MQRANLCLALWLCTAHWGCSCSDPSEILAASREAAEAGDPEAEERELRQGIEAHPDDVELLVAMAELYLRPKPEARYTPRLALHYAIRADRAARQNEPSAASVLHRAYRAAGGFEQAEALLETALAQVEHPDAGNPIRPVPVDPDLLEPTLANLLEQNRRRAGEHLPTCPGELVLVPSGLYPVAVPDDSSLADEVRVESFCAEARPRTDPAQVVLRADEAARLCAARGERTCGTAEQRVLCGPMASVLGEHPACADRSFLRCCAPPSERSGRTGRSGPSPSR